jgi:acetyl-CoA carboxylase carboxyl transferase subunit alpha
MAGSLKHILMEELALLERMDMPALLEKRYRRLRSYGAYETV